jgi:hypothetical protein
LGNGIFIDIRQPYSRLGSSTLGFLSFPIGPIHSGLCSAADVVILSPGILTNAQAIPKREKRLR